MNDHLPRWVDVGLIPFLNLILALIAAGIVVLFIGQDPIEAAGYMISGALGSSYGVGYTLFYTTNFIFTGLAVAVAFHAMQFNIGGEGQALMGAIGVGIAALWLDWSHWTLVLPMALLLSAAFGGFWGFVPAYLQAKRGSHIVITTIMLNFIAAAIIGYVVIYYMAQSGTGAAESRTFEIGAHLPRMSSILAPFGIEMSQSVPLNIMFFIALIALVAVWYLIWKTRLGYEIRAFGFSESASHYAGISRIKVIIIAMVISGAIAGLMANNVVLGEQKRLGLDPVFGAGFVGIAVSLMGRSHPFGIFLAAFLFGILYQGGAELSFMIPEISRDMILTIQGLVILFVGALDNLVRIPVTRYFIARELSS